MKNHTLLTIIFLLGMGTVANARNYYVAAGGNDANSGLSTAAPWQTIAKVNAYFVNMAAGDSILFKRGDIFFGAIVVGKSGTSALPIVISAYGTGDRPVITGFKTLSSWSTAGNGVYQCSLPAAKSTLNLVALNNEPQALGRYPNADAPNGGYLNYENFSTTTSITDNELNNATNWTGAEVAIRKKLWVIDRCKITAHSGGTITYVNPASTTYDATTGYGYFIQNDPRTLDKQGEWYFNNSTKSLQMYFGTALPSSFNIKASVVDTLITINAKNFISINNIAFEGANGNALFATNAGNLTIQNCDFNIIGETGIMAINVSNLLIENCNTNNILSNGIVCSNLRASNTTIRNCVIKNTGKLAGMGLSSGNSYKGIQANVLSNLLVEYNTIDTTGYVALDFQGSNVSVNNNVVNYFCYVKDDAGGIYSYASGTDAAPGTLYSNRVVKNNIVMNGIGAPYGRSNSKLYVSGIYLDGRTMNVDVLNNSVFNIGKNGIHCNNPINVNIKGNTSFNTLNAMSIMRWSWGTIKNLSIRDNIFYPKVDSQRCFYYTNEALTVPTTTTFQQALQGLGNIDSNYYSMINQVGFNFETYMVANGPLNPTSPMSLESWRPFTSHDINSKKPVKLPVNYKLINLVGANKFAAGTFTTNISSVTLYGANVTASWDNTGKISGGALKMQFNAPVAYKYGLIHSPVGAISNTKNYILRFSTYGTTGQGIVRAYIRKSGTPYNYLVPIQVKSFGIGRKDHEFLFTAPIADAAGGSLAIEIEQNSGTTYIDNIEFYEANATVLSVDQQLRFEYNAGRAAKTVALDANYTGVDGTVYNRTITLQPFTSKILLKDTGTISATVLKAVATGTAVNCYGSTTMVTVAASGGTAPYSGTGSFTVAAGTYSYTVTDAAGASTTASINITQPVAALKAAAAAGTITVTGGTASVTVSATGGTAPYTGTGTFTVSAGTYTYTVKDANGCSSLVTITVPSPDSILKITSPAAVTISCYGSTAPVNIGASSGTAPYTGTGAFNVSAGKGSLKLSFPRSAVGNYTLLYYTIGAISSSKNYVLKFSTLGTTAAGSIRASLRQTTSPWAVITAKQTSTYGLGRTEHQFLFTAPASQTEASFLIEIEQSSGTTYVDNIAVFEAAADGTLQSANLYPDGQFESGIGNLYIYSSNGNQTAVWDSTGKISSIHYFAVKDARNNIAVASVKTTQPSAPISMSVTAGTITVAGGTALVTVSAAGGTAPYAGTGNFSVLAGTYTYSVTDAGGCVATAPVTVTGYLARPANTAVSSTTRTIDPSININSKPLSITAYPNPSNSFFTLELNGGSADKISVAVYSFDGRLVYQAAGNPDIKYVFGNNFLAGVYVVKVIQGNSVQSLKLIKGNN